MGKVSTKDNKSIYQLAREERGLSRMDAAELMDEYGVTDYRLVRLESGETAMQPLDVFAMSRAYNKPELRNYYCTHECKIGEVDAPQVKMDSSVHELLVNIVLSLEAVNTDKVRLMEILADGEVASHEAKEFEQIKIKLEQISMAVEALQLWCEKMENSEK